MEQEVKVSEEEKGLEQSKSKLSTGDFGFSAYHLMKKSVYNVIDKENSKWDVIKRVIVMLLLFEIFYVNVILTLPVLVFSIRNTYTEFIIWYVILNIASAVIILIISGIGLYRNKKKKKNNWKFRYNINSYYKGEDVDPQYNMMLPYVVMYSMFIFYMAVSISQQFNLSYFEMMGVSSGGNTVLYLGILLIILLIVWVIRVIWNKVYHSILNKNVYTTKD